MDQKHALSAILSDMHQLLQQIAGSVAWGHCAHCCVHCPAHDGHPGGLIALSGGEWMDRQGVMDYLRISDRTYYRLKAAGTLRPYRFGRRDYYFRADLEGAYRDSVRRGRV